MTFRQLSDFDSLSINTTEDLSNWTDIFIIAQID